MKTVLQILTASLLLAVPSSAQILSEDFTFAGTFPPTGWTRNPTSSPTWETAGVVAGPTVLTADAAAQSTSTPLLVSTLSTPSMSFTGIFVPELVFDSETLGVNNMAHNSGAGQSLVYASTDSGTTFAPIFDYQPAGSGLDAAVTVALPSFAGEPDVRLQFRYRGDNTHLWAIDNVVVQESYTGGPLLQLSAQPVAGQLVDITGSGMTAGGDCLFIFSINGSGPIISPTLGTLSVTPPLFTSPTFQLDAGGQFGFTTRVPLSLSGGTLDGHVIEVQPGPTFVVSPPYSSSVQ